MSLDKMVTKKGLAKKRVTAMGYDNTDKEVKKQLKPMKRSIHLAKVNKGKCVLKIIGRFVNFRKSKISMTPITLRKKKIRNKLVLVDRIFIEIS
jgi:hypothetical protein